MSSANDTNDASEVIVPSEGGSIPHAEGAAEAVVVASDDTAIPMAAAILLDQSSSLSSSNGKCFDSNTSHNNGSIRETIVLHDPNRSPNDATSLETTVLHVEMDGELDAFYDENANATADIGSIEATDHGQSGHDWRSANGFFQKRKWIQIGIIGTMVLISIIIPVSLTALHDENNGVPMDYSWSIRDGGLPPIPSEVASAGIDDDVMTPEDCYSFCDQDKFGPIVGLAFSFNGAFSTIGISEPVCWCYQSIPCVGIPGDPREGFVKSAFPQPGTCVNSSFANGNETRGL